MSKETKNLKLFQYDPATDGDMTFNLDEGLNGNWDKLDEEVSQKAGKAELTTHADDKVKHITAEERTAWNAKQAGLTGKAGQFVGFTEDNVAGAVDAPSGGAPMNGLPTNDIRTYPVRAGQSIKAGDVVNVSGSPETVHKDIVAQANVENVIQGTAIIATSTIKLNSTYSIVATVYQNSSEIILSTVSNFDGRNVHTTDTNIQNVSSVSLARLDDSHFVVQYLSDSLYAKVGLLSGSTISIGSDYQISPSVSTSVTKFHRIIPLSNSDVLAIYMASGLKCKIFSIGGMIITTNSAEYSLGNTFADNISACKLPDDSNGNKRVCICFSDTGDGNKGKAVIATISSSNAVTFGDVVTVRDASVSYTGCAYVDGVIYFFDSINLYALSETLSALGSIDLGTSPASADSTMFGFDDRVIALNGNGVKGAICIRWNGTSFEYGDDYKFNSTARSNYPSGAMISNNQIIFAYADSWDSNYGTTTILEVSGNQIAGSFINKSKDAIALADGTGGQEIPVGFGGYCECPGVTAGQRIDSSGVSAFSPVDGWLYLLGDGMKKLGVRVETGSYIGTGTYGKSNKITLNFSFHPKIIFFREKTKSGSTDCIMIYGAISAINVGSGVEIEWGLNTVSYYNVTNDAYQMNQSGTTYLYAAIG